MTVHTFLVGNFSLITEDPNDNTGEPYVLAVSSGGTSTFAAFILDSSVTEPASIYGMKKIAPKLPLSMLPNGLINRDEFDASMADIAEEMKPIMIEIVNVADEMQFTVNKTFSEILEAVISNKKVYINLYTAILPLIAVFEDTILFGVSFNGGAYLVSIFNSDGTGESNIASLELIESLSSTSDYTSEPSESDESQVLSRLGAYNLYNELLDTIDSKSPTKLSELEEDTTHRTVTDAEKTAWNAKSNFSGNYNDLTNKPSIPSIEGLATTDYVDDSVEAKLAELVDSAPEALNTLNELAAALGDNPNFATTVTTQLGNKADKTSVPTNLANGSIYGSLRAIGAKVEDNEYKLGYCAFAEGMNTIASGLASHAEGGTTIASGSNSHAEGNDTIASGTDSHAEGTETIASGSSSHAEGYQTTAYGGYSHAEGYGPTKTSNYTISGEANATIYTYSGTDPLLGHIICLNNIFAKIISIDKVNKTIILSNTLSIEPISNVNVTIYSGIAFGYYSHAEGSSTASGQYSHAEGAGTASGDNSHAEGGNTVASGVGSHAEGGITTQASGDYSHAEGAGTNAVGRYSHTEGFRTTASGDCSHTEGQSTIASGNYQHVQGQYNIEDTDNKYAHIVGNGNSTSTRSNAHTIDWDGLGWFADSVKVGGAGQDDENAKVLATETYVNDKFESIEIPDMTPLIITINTSSFNGEISIHGPDNVLDLIGEAMSLGRQALLLVNGIQMFPMIRFESHEFDGSAIVYFGAIIPNDSELGFMQFSVDQNNEWRMEVHE